MIPARKRSPANENGPRDDIVVDLYPFIRKYKDGHHERFLHSTFVAASEDAAANRGVATRDVVIDHSTGVSARLFLPCRAAAAGKRLPLVMYIHGGSFCSESAFCRTYHRYATSLAASSGALVVSVEYRLAPENPIPAAYDDAWAALRWMASLSDPWLADYADPGRTFLVGDSAGGNIAYHTAVRAGAGAGEGLEAEVMDIEGLVMVQPYFWSGDRLPSETDSDYVVFPAYGVDRLWPLVTAGHAGNDDPRINPPAAEIASLKCKRVLVAVAERDTLRERGCLLAKSLRDNCLGDKVTMVEAEGEDHGFHLYSPLRATSKELMECVVQFINYQPAPVALQGETETWDGEMAYSMFGVPSRPFKDIFGYGELMKIGDGRSSVACASLKTAQPLVTPTKKRYGLFIPMSASTSVLQSSMVKGRF